jgi:hypothetical protein
MKPPLIGAIGVLLCGSVFGQDLIQCLDPHVEAAFLAAFLTGGNDSAPPLVRGERPPQIADVATPEGFEWMGSLIYQTETHAVFRTDLATADAEQQFLAALRQAGFDTWQDQTPTGFVPSDSLSYTDICRDGAHSSVNVRDPGSRRFVTLTLRDRNPFSLRNAPASCGAPRAAPQPTVILSPSRASAAPSPPTPPRPTPYYENIPRLDLPSGVVRSTRPGALPTADISGSGDTYNYHLEVEGATSSAAIVRHLTPQIVAQGWTAAADWAGEQSAGSAWTRAIDGRRFAGRLSAERIGGGYYSLNFRLVPME